MAPIWVSDKPMLCILMVPLSRAKRTFSADICLKTARFGALGTPPSWQTAQRCLNSVSPSLFVGVTSCLAAARQEGARANKRKASPVRKRRMFEEYLMSNYLPGERKCFWEASCVYGKHRNQSQGKCAQRFLFDVGFKSCDERLRLSHRHDVPPLKEANPPP